MYANLNANASLVWRIPGNKMRTVLMPGMELQVAGICKVLLGIVNVVCSSIRVGSRTWGDGKLRSCWWSFPFRVSLICWALTIRKPLLASRHYLSVILPQSISRSYGGHRRGNIDLWRGISSVSPSSSRQCFVFLPRWHLHGFLVRPVPATGGDLF